MRLKTINFYYFSGTGNTFLVVEQMKQVFEENKVRVNLYRLEKTNPGDVDLNNTIGIAFPVVLQGTFPFVWDFIKSLPTGNKTPIFILDTLQSFSGGVIGPIKKIVKKKNYLPIGAKEILMPSNYLPKEINKRKNEITIRKGLKNAENYANEILNETSKWRRIAVLSEIISKNSQSKIMWKFFRKHYRLEIDKTKCINCGLCVKLCPVNNIEINEYPEFKNLCQFCMRCIMFCPKQAIYLPKKKFVPYHAVKANELLKDE